MFFIHILKEERQAVNFGTGIVKERSANIYLIILRFLFRNVQLKEYS